jgi:hypothetical protein
MRILLTIIFLAVFVCGLTQGVIRAEEYAPTAAQKHFTAIVKGLPGVVSAEWKSPISLWVRASEKTVGSPPDKGKVKILADTLAERGRTALRQPFCVHIYQQSASDLARSCVY